MSEYIGNRIVPRHDGVWDKTKEYEPLTIVYEEATGDSYISRKSVPAGTLLAQEEYWAMCSRFSEQMALHRKRLRRMWLTSQRKWMPQIVLLPQTNPKWTKRQRR